MSIRRNTPCDCDGFCPYDAEYSHTCEYWCGEDEPEDEDYDDYKEDYDINFEWDSTDLEEGYDPYLGCYTDDC